MWATGERRLGYAALLAVVASCWLSATALAAFPGHNGGIAYSKSFVEGESTSTRIFATGLADPISAGAIDAVDPAWSPDGSRIAYMALGYNTRSVNVINEDGSADTVLDASSFESHDPSWSPDGRTVGWDDVAFVDDDDVPRVVAKPVGSSDEPTEIATRPSGTISGVAWSHDGAVVAFVWAHLGCSEELPICAELNVVSASGGTPSRLGAPVSAPSRFSRGDVAWSPDGTKIAVAYRPGDLRVVSAKDGAELTRIVDAGAPSSRFTDDSGRHVTWSPDGSRIAFVGGFGSGSAPGTSLLTVPATGGAPDEIVDSLSEGGIDWQPLQAPVTTITKATSGVTRATSASFAFVANKSPATYECRLDSRPWTPCASGVEYTGLAVGSHAFSVRATWRGIVEERPPERSWEVLGTRTSPPPKSFSKRTGIRARWFRFVYPRHMVQLQALRAVHVPKGVTIDVRCDGPGCPGDFHRQFRTHRFRTSKRVIAGLRDAQLLPRAAVFVTLTKPGYIGIGKMYCVRYNRHVRVRVYDPEKRPPTCGPATR